MLSERVLHIPQNRHIHSMTVDRFRAFSCILPSARIIDFSEMKSVKIRHRIFLRFSRRDEKVHRDPYEARSRGSS